MDWFLISQVVTKAEKDYKLDQIYDVVKKIKASIDNRTVTDIQAGFEHLVTALNSEKESVYENELNNSRILFNKLIHLPPEETTNGIDNKKLITFSYIGNYYYFYLMNDTKNCAKYVYEGTLHNWDCIYYFPQEFYDKDYVSNFNKILLELKPFEKRLSKANWNNFWEQSKHFSLKGIAVIGIGSLAYVGSLLSFGAAAPAGLYGIKKVLEGEIIEKPHIEETSGLKSDIQRLKNQFDKNSNELTKECKRKLELVQKFTINDLLKRRT